MEKESKNAKIAKEVNVMKRIKIFNKKFTHELKGGKSND